MHTSLASQTAFFSVVLAREEKGLVYQPAKTSVMSYPVYGRRRLAGSLTIKEKAVWLARLYAYHTATWSREPDHFTRGRRLSIGDYKRLPPKGSGVLGRDDLFCGSTDFVDC